MRDRSRFMVKRVYQQVAGALVRQAVTASSPADGANLIVNSPEDFDEDGGTGVFEPDTDRREVFQYHGVDQATNELLGVTRPNPTTHAEGTFVQAGKRKRKELWADGYLEDEETIAHALIPPRLAPYFRVGSRNQESMESTWVIETGDGDLEVEDAPQNIYRETGDSPLLLSSDYVVPRSHPLNLLMDAGFELDDGSWELESSNFQVLTDSLNAFASSKGYLKKVAGSGTEFAVNLADFECRPADSYYVTGHLKSTAGTVGDATFGIRFYNSSGAVIANSTITLTNGVVPSYSAVKGRINGVAGAARARVFVRTVGHTAGVWYFDDILVTPIPIARGVSLYLTAAQSIANAPANNVPIVWSSDVFDSEGVWPGTNANRYVIPFEGNWQLYAELAFAGNVTGRRIVEIWDLTNLRAIKTARLAAQSAAFATHVSTQRTLWLDIGTEIQVRAYQDSGGALNVTAGEDQSTFSATYLGR